MLTPQTQGKKIAKALGLTTELYLKREDLHPYGSHKGRSIPFMIEYYINNGKNNFCISSSGNAALAAIYSIKELNKKQTTEPITLHIFIGRHIQQNKLELLKETIGKDNNVTLKQVENPKQMAFQMDKAGAAKNLRQSTDDTALIGYQALADELAAIKHISAVFIPTSSGTTAQGLYLGFQKHNINPQIHIVQTPKCHPLVDDSPIGPSVATAIVDTVGYRKIAVQKAMHDSNGQGWIATNDDIAKTKSRVKESENLEISSNSALSIAGLILAIEKDRQFDGPVVCLITGK